MLNFCLPSPTSLTWEKCSTFHCLFFIFAIINVDYVILCFNSKRIFDSPTLNLHSYQAFENEIFIYLMTLRHMSLRINKNPKRHTVKDGVSLYVNIVHRTQRKDFISYWRCRNLIRWNRYVCRVQCMHWLLCTEVPLGAVGYSGWQSYRLPWQQQGLYCMELYPISWNHQRPLWLL